ncbi:hypothetical protein DFJ73DRAFT_957831 [Zopfochytrium polystomum]|nr:hypothetical protein DFJ73DRAFT_957831 [Zopfochytrium polystomum]
MLSSVAKCWQPDELSWMMPKAETGDFSEFLYFINVRPEAEPSSFPSNAPAHSGALLPDLRLPRPALLDRSCRLARRRLSPPGLQDAAWRAHAAVRGWALCWGHDLGGGAGKRGSFATSSAAGYTAPTSERASRLEVAWAGEGWDVLVDWQAYTLECMRDPHARNAWMVFGITEELAQETGEDGQEVGGVASEDGDVQESEDDGGNT